MGNFPCELCAKVCKSKGGLTRHTRTKHVEKLDKQVVEVPKDKIHNLRFKVLIEKATIKLSNDKCFAKFKDTFSNFKISTDQSLEIWKTFVPIYNKFNGNAEKFYSDFYQMILPGTHIFTSLPNKLSTLLGTEVANLSLEYLLVGHADSTGVEIKVELTKDINCLQYLAGYCFRTLFTRIRNSKNWNTNFSLQCLSILKAAKSSSEQVLVDAKDRGGLWKVNNRALNIFVVCEKVFLQSTANFSLKIQSQVNVETVLRDVLITSDMKAICRDADQKVDKEVAKNLFENLVSLFIRVRSHSFAKSIREKHKASHKAGKKRSLRIKQSNSSTELGH